MVVNVDLVIPKSGIYAASGAHVITDIDVVVSSGINVVTSGQTIVMDGIDYIQSGTQLQVINSGWISGTVGQFRMATAMKGLESVVSGWVGMANETRIFTGADAKHIRFQDDFQATAIDPVKWNVDAGTVTVANGYLSLDWGQTTDIVTSKQKFLYGVLSMTVMASNWTSEFGFQSDTYMQGGNSIVKIDNSQFETMNVATNAATRTDILGMPNPMIWTNIDIVWTPTYCQLWMNNELRATHTTNIPNSPASIYFRNPGDFCRIANVTLRPYGDIPITAQGSVPVAGAYIANSGMMGMEYIPIQVCSSGEVVVCSGLHVVADVEVDVSSGIHVIQESGAFVQISGQHVYVESGVYFASGLAVTIESGIHTVDGQTIQSWDTLMPTQASGGEVIGSGPVDRVILRVPEYGCSGYISPTSGDTIKGIWVGGKSGDEPYTGSGCINSGHGLFLGIGCQKELHVKNFNEIYIAGEPSGQPVTYIGEII